MMTLVSARTYFVSTCLVLGIVMAPYLGDLLYFKQDREEMQVKPEAARALPEVAMLPPREEAPSEELVEPPAVTPVQHQSAPAPPATEAREEPKRQEAPAQAAPRQKEKEPVAAKPQKAEPLPKKKEIQPAAKLKVAQSEPAREPSVHEKLKYKELVAMGRSLNRKGIKSPGYRASMAPEVIESLNRNGTIRLGVTDGVRTYLFRGTLQRPGEGRFAMGRDFRGWSTRYMQLDRYDGRKLLQAARGEFQGGTAHCQPVMFLSSEIDFMVLGSQEHAAASKGVGLEDLKSTSGQFRIYKGRPFNYSIEKIQLKK